MILSVNQKVKQKLFIYFLNYRECEHMYIYIQQQKKIYTLISLFNNAL